MTDHQYADLLDRATAGLAVPPDLVAGAIATGRRRRRRSTTAVVAAGVVIAGALGAGAVQARSDPRPASVQVADPAPTPSGMPSAPPSAAVGQPPRRFGMDPAKTAHVLASLLTGTVTRPQSWSERPAAPDGFQAGSVLLDGALVTILLEHTTLPRCGEQPPLSACDSLGNGFSSTATWDEPRSGASGTTGVRASSATLFTADHLAVTATAYNAASEKGSDPLMDQPVLSEAQLLALVQDPVWLEEQQ